MKPEHLTQKETDEVLSLFTTARKHLRLDQWDIIVMDAEPEGEDVAMDVTPQPNHFSAQVRVCRDFGSMTTQAKRDTAVHELLHLCHRDLSDLWEQMTEGNTAVSRDVCGLMENAWFLQIERMVSHLSKIISEGIDWPAGKVATGQGIFVQGEHR